MKQWTKVKFESLNDERIQNLIKKEGMKGFGIYMMLFIYCDCYNGMSKETLELIVSKFSSRNIVNKILIEYGLFEVGQDGLVRACLRELTRAQARDSAEASASQLTGAGHSNGFKEREREITLDEDELKFRSLMEEKYPNVMALKKPLRKYEYDRAVARFGEECVVMVIQAMENKPNLPYNYVSANLTMLDWCKRRQEPITHNH